jgi:CRISPR-associated protein Cmr3
MIYQTEFMRPAPGTGLLVWLDPSVELEPEGWLALGGQARSARYSVCADAEVEPLPALRPAASRIKALLLTPAYFEGGWQPKDGNWARLLRVQRADPVAVALGRPMLLGSRDIANTRHRDMHAYVPAGSVYFFEVDPPLASLAGPLTESPREALDHRCLGFGQVAIGTWDWLE